MMRTALPVALAALLLSATLAFAQQGPRPYNAQSGGPEQQQGGPPDLRQALGLRPDQEAAYRAFMAGSQPSQAQMERDRREADQLTTLRTPQRLDMIAAKMARDQAAFTGQAAAVKRFYAALTPAQQRTFDQITAPPADDGQGGPQGSPQGGSDQPYPGNGYAPPPR